MLSVNESGQGFSVFRLLIGAIMGLMILLIILGITNYFEQMRLNLGVQKVNQSFLTAANKHNGTVIKLENVELPAGTEFSSLSFSNGSGVEKNCIRITGMETPDIVYSSIASGGYSVKIGHYAMLSIYFRCETSATADCEVYCTVSLNKKLEQT